MLGEAPLEPVTEQRVVDSWCATCTLSVSTLMVTCGRGGCATSFPPTNSPIGLMGSLGCLLDTVLF